LFLISALLLTIVFLLAFIHPGTYAIGDSDEAVHTANVYEMYKSGIPIF
jgi:hypothetical protein